MEGVHPSILLQLYEWEAEEKQVKAKAKILSHHQNLNKEKWWKSVANASHVMTHVMYVIHNLDQKAANLGKVWMTRWNVQRSLEYLEEIKDSVVKP